MFVRTACLLAVSALALAACGEPTPEPADAAPAEAAAAPSEPAASGTITVDGEGLRISTVAPALIAFGTPTAEVIAAVKAAYGADPVATANPDCPNGATQDYAWGNRLAVITRDGAFVGWHSSESGPTTSSGVHAGSPRSAAAAGDSFQTVESNFEQTQIAVDGVNGFLTDDGETVGVLFAGDTCIAS